MCLPSPVKGCRSFAFVCVSVGLLDQNVMKFFTSCIPYDSLKIIFFGIFECFLWKNSCGIFFLIECFAYMPKSLHSNIFIKMAFFDAGFHFNKITCKRLFLNF